MKKTLALLMIFSTLSTTLLAREDYCTFRTDTMDVFFLKQEFWFNEIVAKKSNILPTIIFDEDIFLKSTLGIDGTFHRTSFSKFVSIDHCEFRVSVSSSASESKSILIKKNTKLVYGQAITTVDGKNGSLTIFTKNKLMIGVYPFIQALSDKSCNVNVLYHAVKKAGLSLVLVHPSNAPECKEVEPETDVITIQDQTAETKSSIRL